jgi:hypothetical protein
MDAEAETRTKQQEKIFPPCEAKKDEGRAQRPTGLVWVVRRGDSRSRKFGEGDGAAVLSRLAPARPRAAVWSAAPTFLGGALQYYKAAGAAQVRPGCLCVGEGEMVA